MSTTTNTNILADIKIITYNVSWTNFTSYLINAQSKQILDILSSSNADIICLQETNRYCEHQYHQHALKKSHPHCKFFEHAEYQGGGCAILCKSNLPIAHVTMFQPNVEGSYFPAMIAQVTVPHLLQPLFIVNVHLRPGISMTDKVVDHVKCYFATDMIRLQEMKQIVQQIGTSSKYVIVCGDLNESNAGAGSQYLRNALQMDDAVGNKSTWYYYVIWKLHVAGAYISAFSLYLGSFDHIFYTKQSMQAGKCEICTQYSSLSDHVPVQCQFKLLSL